MDELRTELATSDVVYLAVPLTEELDGLIGPAELRAMKPTGILVNVARGRHVDTDALVLALRDGWIAGAGLDVTDPEPLPDGHPCGTSHMHHHIASARKLGRDVSEGPLAERIAAKRRLVSAPGVSAGVIDPSKGY